MAIKKAFFKIKGMQRDLSASAFTPEYAYENKNIRITATDDNTLYSITNEKGNKYARIKGIQKIEGTPIGQAIINDTLILFTTNASASERKANIDYSTLEIDDIRAPEIEVPGDVDSSDNIYKIEFNDNNELVGNLLFRGNLDLSAVHPLETLSYYENKEVLKVYWVDGLNLPRVINIAEKDPGKWNDESFNFVLKLKLNEVISVKKNLNAGGKFSPGTVLYAFTYYNKFGLESNIFYTTPLYYISNIDRGNSADSLVSNSFSITIKGIDTSFDYIRIYSIHRSSLDTTPEVKRLVDLSTTTDILGSSISSRIDYEDNGSTGETVDPTLLLYIGGDKIKASTINLKDNTLFLGDIKLDKLTFSKDMELLIRDNCKISTYYESIPYVSPYGYYPYESQLNRNSNEIKGFKGGEWYRLAIQFLHLNGNFTEPVWLGDYECDLYPLILKDDVIVIKGLDTYHINIPKFKCEGLKSLIKFLPKELIRARLMMASPSSTDKSIICQGIVCPTLYNMEDRYSNSPFAISSWFMRPDCLDRKDNHLEYRHNFPLPSNEKRNCEILNTFKPNYPYTKISKTKEIPAKCYFVFNNYIGFGFRIEKSEEIPSLPGVTRYSYNSILKEALKYMTRNSIPKEEEWKTYNSPDGVKLDIIYRKLDSNNLESFVNKESNNFYVDLNILTFHTPNIENYKSDLESAGIKMRIVGIAQITSSMSDYSITTSSSKKNPKCAGRITYNKDVLNLSQDAHGLINAPLWNDSLFISDYNYSGNEIPKDTSLFAIYPWHRNGPLNNDANTDNSKKTAILKNKKMSNYRFSYFTRYFDKNKIWTNPTGISNVIVFNSDVLSNVKIKNTSSSKIEEINYYGNIDKIVNFNFNKDEESKKGYPILSVGKLLDNLYYTEIDSLYEKSGEGKDPVSIRFKSTPHAVFSLSKTENGFKTILPALNELDSFINYDENRSNEGVEPWEEMPFINVLSSVGENPPLNPEDNDLWYDSKYKLINVYSKSTSKWITVLSPDTDELYWYLDGIYYLKYIEGSSFKYDLIEYLIRINQQIIGETSEYPFLYIAEFYREVNDDFLRRIYGGQSESALINNLWIPISRTFNLNSVINETEGDTFFLRWDCLKTYAYTNEDPNSIIDVTSVMLESRTNLDGRYDKNRGLKNILVANPTNFNLFNPVYSQSNNFFNHRILDSKFDLNEFPNTITWTKTKKAAEDVDTWTNITMASTLDLDGDKGPVRAIKRLNNNLIAFLDRGISLILYNENVLINAANGVPIEIANSGKVLGKRYITDKIGCTNKWSICDSPRGLYFVDDITKGIYNFNGEISNISDKNGFHSWINKESKSLELWDPLLFNNIVSYYDKSNNDVLFITKDQCLAYSEILGGFTSFYSYESTPYINTLKDITLSIRLSNNSRDNKNYKIWMLNKGEYNSYFNDYRPFYTTIIANPDTTEDKIFNNIEFRADSWLGNTLINNTFDYLYTKNEYLEGEANLKNIFNKPSNIKNKFRIWRANIPRDKSNGRDRMRNPWLYIKLAKNELNNFKTVLHDMIVYYFD